MLRTTLILILALATTPLLADNRVSPEEVAAQRQWLQLNVVEKVKDKKRRKAMQAQLARLNPRQVIREAKRYQTLYDRRKAAEDRFSTQSPGKKRAAQRALAAAGARRNRIQVARNIPGGFSPVIRSFPGSHSQPANPIRTVPLPMSPVPVLRLGPIPFTIKTGFAPNRQTPGWYKKIRSR